jgi:hypothetical protein
MAAEKIEKSATGRGVKKTMVGNMPRADELPCHAIRASAAGCNGNSKMLNSKIWSE